MLNDLLIARAHLIQWQPAPREASAAVRWLRRMRFKLRTV